MKRNKAFSAKFKCDANLSMTFSVSKNIWCRIKLFSNLTRLLNNVPYIAWQLMLSVERNVVLTWSSEPVTSLTKGYYL